MPVKNDENLGLAFGLVIGAGLSTALGAAVVFSPTLVKYASRRTLAGALGLSAGVMTYVSFVEIFQKSTLSFEDAGFDEDKAYVYATLCFFGGVFFMVALNHVVTWLLGGHHHHHHHPGPSTQTNTHESDTPADDNAAAPTCPCHSEDPVADLANLHDMADQIEAREQEEHCCDDSNCQEEKDCEDAKESRGQPSVNGSHDDNHASSKEAEDSRNLMRMSVNTAVAIGLHNFPEGLATFVATLNDPGVGAVLAVAIAIHNIPEGLCVAMPIYYATGNRLKAFGWALFSGIAEPIAALLGWAVLANSFSDTLYAILFGMVAGMMVIISTRELLPTAHRYDPEDSVVTYSFMAGMVTMAVSLVLFVI